MTFNVDNDALKVAMMRHYEEKLAKELREMFVFSSNPDTARIWQLYTEEVQRREEERKDNVQDFWKAFMRVAVFTLVAYFSYRLMTL
jgi:hypothetical protein